MKEISEKVDKMDKKFTEGYLEKAYADSEKESNSPAASCKDHYKLAISGDGVWGMKLQCCGFIRPHQQTADNDQRSPMIKSVVMPLDVTKYLMCPDCECSKCRKHFDEKLSRNSIIEEIKKVADYYAVTCEGRKKLRDMLDNLKDK